MLSITVRKRGPGPDYAAMCTNDKRVWEAGRTEAEAIGKLMITLDAAARAKQGLLAWLPRSDRIRIERE